jgi:hypothetical protein
MFVQDGFFYLIVTKHKLAVCVIATPNAYLILLLLESNIEQREGD